MLNVFLNLQSIWRSIKVDSVRPVKAKMLFRHQLPQHHDAAARPGRPVIHPVKKRQQLLERLVRYLLSQGDVREFRIGLQQPGHFGYGFRIGNRKVDRYAMPVIKMSPSVYSDRERMAFPQKVTY